MDPHFEPDTRFLEKAADLALSSIINRLDRERDFQPYFMIDLDCDPPEAKHDSWDYCDMSGRYVDALILVRQMTGNSQGIEEETGLREFLLKRCRGDGLFYNEAGPSSECLVDMFCQGRVLLGLVSWYLQTGDTRIEGKIEGMIRGLDRIASQGDGFCWYPRDRWANGEWIPGGLWDGRYPAYGLNQLLGLARYFEASGSETAKVFIEKLVHFYVRVHEQIKLDGSFTGHTHSGGVLPTVIGILRFALAADNEELVLWCHRAFLYAKKKSTSFGWVPDGMGFEPDYPFGKISETCSIVDLIHLAIKFSEAGFGPYWDDVERWTRNQLLENQYRNLDETIPEESWKRSVTGVARMFIGGFEGWAKPNGLLSEAWTVEGCCAGSGPRGCFLVWDRIVQKRPEGISVNMLFSRDSQWANITSFEPYEGRIEVVLKENSPLFIRLPSWAVNPSIRVDGNEQPMQMRGEYAFIPDARASQKVELLYTQSVKEEEQTVGGERYHIRWKGGTVTRLDPPGKRYPIFQREYFEASEAPTVPKIYTPKEIKVRW